MAKRLGASKAFGLPAIAAGLALGVTVVVLMRWERLGYSSINDSYLALINGFLLFLVISLAVLYIDTRRSRLRAAARGDDQIERILRHILHIASARAVLSAQNVGVNSNNLTVQDRAVQTSAFLKLLIEEAKRLFDEYVGHSCNVSLKLLYPGDGDSPRVYPYLRDERSGVVRAKFPESSEVYPYTEHSPFVDILTRRYEKDFYLDNDLRTAESRGLYLNGNPHWKKFYNATLIVPITSYGTDVRENIAGFLCIDSLNGKFDQKVCPYLARIVASSTFLAIYELSLLERQRADESVVEREVREA